MSNTTILEGPDGRLYEIPNDQLAEFAVPGERVAELRKRMAGSPDPIGPMSPAVGGDSDELPPGHARMPPGNGAGPGMSFHPGAGVVLNFFFHGPPPNGVPNPPGPPAQAGLEGYHMTFDENGIPVNHTEMLWGDYVDKQGNPAVGWHSHDPVTGNAQ